jgi:hypothetical protein
MKGRKCSAEENPENDPDENDTFISVTSCRPPNTINDGQLERLMEGISHTRLAQALGPRLDILFAERTTGLNPYAPPSAAGSRRF